MAMYGPDAVNELLNITFDVQATAANLPGMTTKSFGDRGFSTYYPTGPKQGQPFDPVRAYINVETGALRMRCDGIDPAPGMGTLYTAPAVIDWSSALSDYSGMLKAARLCRENSGTATAITISYRN